VSTEMATLSSLNYRDPFTSIVDIAQKKYKIYPAKFMILDKFSNLSKIKKLIHQF